MPEHLCKRIEFRFFRKQLHLGSQKIDSCWIGFDVEANFVFWSQKIEFLITKMNVSWKVVFYKVVPHKIRVGVTSRWCFLTAKKKIYGRESINLHIWPWKNRNVSVRPNSSCIERSVWGKFKKNFVWKLDKMNKLCPFD